MPYLNSTTIVRAEYDDVTSTLRVWFGSNRDVYDYFGVPRHHYEGLCNAASPGRYFSYHIREQYGRQR